MHATIQERIRSIFDSTQDPQEALIRVYRLFIPDWDINRPQLSTPKCGNSLYRYLASLFHILDYKNHPNEPTGQLWARRGFSRDMDLENWEFKINTCKPHESSCFT